jgi:ferric enterobactin receptor
VTCVRRPSFAPGIYRACALGAGGTLIPSVDDPIEEKRSMRPGRVLWCLPVLLLVTGQALAQCRVEGTVKSEDGAPLAGATLRIELPELKVPLTTTVGEDGRYVIENVKAGSRVRIVVVQGGRLVAEAFALVTQWVEPVDIVSRPSATRVMGSWDLDPSSGPSGALIGVVRGADGMPLPAARVTIGETELTATTDSMGRYSLGRLRSGVAVNLEVSAPGFKGANAEVIVPDDGRLESNFTLQRRDRSDERVPDLPVLYPADDVGQFDLSPAEAAVPSVGRHDVFRAIQFLPGAQATPDVTSELYVRGGTPGETLMTLDGFTLYPVSRPFGQFSAVNMDAVAGAQFSRTTLSAADGGRLSGAMRLTGSAGDSKRPTGSVDLSFLGARGVFSTPLGRFGSVLVAARTSPSSSLYNDVLDLYSGGAGDPARERTPGSSAGAFKLSPTSRFRDMNGKLVLTPTSKDRLSFTFYDGEESANNSRSLGVVLPTQTGIVAPTDAAALPADAQARLTDLLDWTARGFSGAWTRQWSAAASTVFSVGRSKMSARTERASVLASPTVAGDFSLFNGRGGSNATSDQNDITDTTIRLENRIAGGFGHAFTFGGEIASIDVLYDLQREALKRAPGGTYNSTALSGFLFRKESGRLYTGFVQDSWRPFTALSLSPGVRATHYNLTSTTYIDPRLAVAYQVSSGFKLKAGGAIDHQLTNRITREDRMLGDRDFWYLADDSNVLVPTAKQATAGFSLARPGFLWDVEAYYRNLQDLTIFAPRLAPGLAPDATTRLFHHGKGLAQGVDVLLQKEWPLATVWTGYSLSRIEYTYPTLEAGTFPGSQDQHHEFKAAGTLRIMAPWSVSGSWVLATGRPFSLASNLENLWFPTGLALRQVTFGAKNADHQTALHRLDLSSEYQIHLGALRSTVGATVFNVYNRRNAWYQTVEVTNQTVNDFALMGRAVNVFLRVGF